jgi:16S rRNA (guanine527-N7)-methyltransferase
VSEQAFLISSASRLGVSLDSTAAKRLLQLLDELERWNRSFNLTAITQRAQMLTHHLLDSLSIAALLQGERIIDIGTGAGFPGLPLAIIQPERQFTLLDSNGKKIRFVNHAARTLGLANVVAVHARADARLRAAT